jgi:hypothetical protein
VSTLVRRPSCSPTDVNLDDRGIARKELLVRKVGPDHQQQVGVHDRMIAGRESEQAGHPDVKRIVVFDELFPAHRVHNRRIQRSVRAQSIPKLERGGFGRWYQWHAGPDLGTGQSGGRRPGVVAGKDVTGTGVSPKTAR